MGNVKISGQPSVYWLKKIDEFLNNNPDEIFLPKEVMDAIGLNNNNYKQFMNFVGPERFIKTKKYGEIYIGCSEKIKSFREEYKDYLV